jgi:small subunit ribosomal protein S18
MYKNNKTTQTIKVKPKDCYLCTNNLSDADYKDVELLKRFTSSYGKIMPPKRTGACRKHQKIVAEAIKNSRIMGFMPFIVE